MENNNGKDFTRMNILKATSNENLVKKIAKVNFQRLFEQNYAQLEQKLGLKRSDIIHVYTKFISIYML